MHQPDSALATKWTPHLRGDLLVSAQTALPSIADRIIAHGASTDDGSLYSGAAGHALFFAHAFAFSQDSRYAQAAEAACVRAAAWIGTVPLRPALFTGYIGVLWALRHVASLVPSYNAPDDTKIQSKLSHFVLNERSRRERVDLLHGSVGILLSTLQLPSSTTTTEMIMALTRHITGRED